MKLLFTIFCFFILSISYSQLRNNNPNVFNVKLFGADNSGATDATTAIQATITACNASGGGIVFFPNGRYKISGALGASNSQIFIPTSAATATTRNHITLMGESKPNFIPVGGGLSIGATIPATINGVVLESSLTTGATGAAVVGTDGPFNYTFLSVENIAILVKNNPAGAGPVVGGISYKNGSSLNCKNVTVSIDTAGFRSTHPLNDLAGIETPDQGSEAFNYLENTLCIGFKSDYKIGEHTVLINTSAWCGYYGYFIKLGNMPSVASRAESQWNVYDIYGGGIATLANWNLETEWQQVGKWYDYITMVKDSASILQGQISYTYTFAGGTPLTVVLKSGAAQLNLTPHLEGTASGYVDRVVTPIITAGALDSTTIKGGVGTLSSLILKATSGASANSVMRFLTDNTVEVMRMKGLVISMPEGVNVGIGTPSPNANAGFSGVTMNGASGGILDINVNGTGTAKMAATANTMILRAGSSSRIGFQINGGTSDAMTLSSGGLLGINRTPTTDFLEVAGNVSLFVAGNKLKIAEGSNASIGVSGAMTAGAITISTTAVTANSRIQLTHATLGGTQGILSVGTIVAGTSFVINSSNAADTGTVNWWIVN